MFTGLNWVLHTVGNYVGVYARGVTRSSTGQVAQKIGWNSHKNRGDDSHPNISICAECTHTCSYRYVHRVELGPRHGNYVGVHKYVCTCVDMNVCSQEGRNRV